MSTSDKLRLLHQQVDLAIAEALQSQARASHFGLRVTTRAYQERVVHDGHGRQLTERELEQDEITTQATHIDLAEQHLNRAKRLLREIDQTLEAQK
jgi:hypothetical protein